MSKFLREAALLTIVFVLFTSLLQTEHLLYYYQSLPLFRVYFWVSAGLICICTFFLIRNFQRGQSIFPYIIKKFRSLPIPRAARYLILIAFTGNLMAISLGKPRYPFYDVGMYRYPVDFTGRDKVFQELKYYYWQHGRYKILELRKEGSFFLAEHFGRGYSHDFTYSTAYFHKGEKENFEFLSRAMKEKGVDTLWVGVHSVNFETREVMFDPDICNAIKINQTVKLYYGPIYIPGYQMEKCTEIEY